MDNIPGNTFGTGIGKRTIVNKAPIPKPTPEENKISFTN
jgi:hypothetical protein